tara:strand:+ start:1020 stop:1349 length:330 start_codon:yes stop_codon:yes gene_type:complete
MIYLLQFILDLGILTFVGTLSSNFLFQTLRPDWDRRKHILWSSIATPAGGWLMVTSLVCFEAIYGGYSGGFYSEMLLYVVAVTILAPFLVALFGIPASLLILKYTNWKK